MTEITGTNGAISFDGQQVVITRKGFRAMVLSGARGEKRIPLRSIGSVHYKKAGLMTGYIQLAVVGDTQTGGRSNTANIQQDENAVTFWQKQNAEFQAIADQINDALLAGIQPAAADLADQIGKLAALRDHGALTEDEFAAKKSELLARL